MRYACLLCLLAAPALAQDTQDEPARVDLSAADAARSPWQLKFEPAAWYASASGDLKMSGSAGAGNGQTLELGELNLDSPRLTPLGELQLKRGDWRIRVSGLGFSTSDRDAVATAGGQFGAAGFASGDTLRSSFDFFTLAADGGYTFHRYQAGELDDGGARLRSTVTGFGGVRAIDYDAETLVFTPGSSTPSGTASAGSFHAHPYGGVRWELDIHEQFTIDLLASMGGLQFGDTESWSADIMVGFQWNPTANFGAQIGYRQLLFGSEEGEAPTEMSFQGGLAGVYAGATFRF